MYIVRTGTVILRSGKRKLEEVGPGGVVGEMALIDPAPRSATAVAGPGCTVTTVTEHTFQDLVKKIPGLAIEVMRIITRRLRRANEVQAPARRKPAAPKRKPATARRKAPARTTPTRARAKKPRARRK
jgi:CRP-like cAMP-binding protein